MTSLAGRGERAVLDRLCHASLIDGARLSGAVLKRYAHVDATAALQMLAAGDEAAALLATDGVFSMDGDLAPLPQLAQAASAAQAWLVVDDAHGLGVLGAKGRGTLEHFGLDAQAAPVLVGTLGKAFGSFGAFVAGDAALMEFLIQNARSYIYTTALPQPVAAATRAALRCARRRLAARAGSRAHRRFRARAQPQACRSRTRRRPSSRCCWEVPPAALAAQAQLAAAGFLVVAIRPPTVPAGSARLRVTLSAAHTEAQVDALVDALAPACARARAGTGVSALHAKVSGRGPDLVLLHGWAANLGVWKELTRALSHKFRVISLTCRATARATGTRAPIPRPRRPGACTRPWRRSPSATRSSAGRSAASSRWTWRPPCPVPSRTWCW